MTGDEDWLGRQPPDDEVPEKELALQRRLAEAPWLLPGVSRGPTAAAQEVRVSGAGRADVVVVDGEGAITVVECKRAANSKFRRWVIGQTFSYAAGLWKLDYKDFDRAFAARGVSIKEALREAAPSAEALRNAITQNLADGSFNLIIAVDISPDELRRTVVYLNSHTRDDVSVVGLEMGDPAAKDWNLTEPTVFGLDARECGPLEPRWGPDRWTLIEGIEDPAAAEVAERLLDWADRQNSRVTVKHEPNYAAVKTKAGKRSLFRIVEHRNLRVSFSFLRGDQGRIAQLRRELLDIEPAFVGEKPLLPLTSLAAPGKVDQFLGLMQRNLDALPE